MAAGNVGRWTRYFTVASALSMVVLQVALVVDASRPTVATVGIFGAVLPMVFGMGYVLLPSYVGRTLSARRLPGVHFAVAYAGAGILVGDALAGLGATLLALGGVLWSVGVAIFVGTVLRTVVPAVVTDPRVVLRDAERPQRSTRLATAVLPVAIGYLLVGTVALLSMTTPLPDVVGATLPAVVHYYGAGFAALLVFALGVRLLTGFFHVTPPRYGAWLVLASGAVAPGVVARNFWQAPWFRIGALLELVAMGGYLGLVGVVAYRTDRRRIGLYGIVLGAVGGAVAVGTAGLVAFDGAPVRFLAVHVVVVLDGFFLLTIVGYAYQFFPVTNRQFPGATERTALGTILFLASGVFLQSIGVYTKCAWIRSTGIALAVAATAGYSYLMARRLLR